MTFRVTILPRAHQDINRNADWWAEHHSLEQALHWSDAVYDQLDTLRDLPTRHSHSAENDEFDYEIRDKPVGLRVRPRYRAVFTIQNDEVFVLAVRSAEQDRLLPTDVDFRPDLESDVSELEP